jgi:hypothetical protein
MPNFNSNRTLLLQWLDIPTSNRLGTHFFIVVAPPGDDLTGPDRTAFFYPSSDTTFVGSDVYLALNLANLKPDAPVHFAVRDCAGKHEDQLDIEVLCKNIRLANKMPADWIKIGFDSIKSVLDIKPSFPPGNVSLPATVILEAKAKRNCMTGQKKPSPDYECGGMRPQFRSAVSAN